MRTWSPRPALIALLALSTVMTAASANDPPAKADAAHKEKTEKTEKADKADKADKSAKSDKADKMEAPGAIPSIKPKLSSMPPPAASKQAAEGDSEADLSEKIAARLAEMRARQAARVAAATKARQAAAAKARAKAAEPPPALVRPPANGTVWAYDGDLGPSNWDKINAAWSLCGNGTRQSPIDIRDGMKVDLEQIAFEYQPSSFNEIDNGKTIQVTVSGGNYITVQGRMYELQYITFHRPAEARINGRGFEMSAHLVHKDGEGRIAMLALLLERGKPQPVIQTVWNNLPLEKLDTAAPVESLDPLDLIPARRDYFTFMGSMTTPPCNEGVLWLVMKEPVQASPEQLALFSRLYPYNARPVQPSSGRIVKESK